MRSATVLVLSLMPWRRRKPAPETLVCPGVFAVDLPPGWTSTGEPGEHYELGPAADGPDVAVRISVSPLSDTLREQGVVEVLRWFAGAGYDEPAGFSATTAHEPAGEKAFGRWKVEDRVWFGGVLFVHDTCVIASSTSPYGDTPAYRLGEQLIAGIRPL